MARRPAEGVTEALAAISLGEDGASERLFKIVYDELREMAARLMRGERQDHLLQPTALVNEAAIRLLSRDGLSSLDCRDRGHFFAAVGRAMRRVLVDYARERDAKKRGGSWARTPLDDAIEAYESRNIDLLALDEALEVLEGRHPRWHEVITLRHFCGFTHREIAEQLGVSESTVRNDIDNATEWLLDRLGEGP